MNMIPELPSQEEMRNYVRRRRMELGLSQNKLAKITEGASQSLITKFETGRIDTTYGTVVELCEALRNYAEKKKMVSQKSAGEIRRKKIVFAALEMTISEAAEIMKKNDFSQLPVGDRKKVVGSISDKDIVASTLEHADPGLLRKMPVERIMSGNFPIVDESTKENVVKKLLLPESAVLVSRRDEMIGIITKADFLSR